MSVRTTADKKITQSDVKFIRQISAFTLTTETDLLFTLTKINTISPLLKIPNSPVPQILAINHEHKKIVARLLQYNLNM
jgi:hypothetical protein